MPDPTAQRTGCPFADRCKYAFERCRVEHPRFIDAGNGHRVRCFKVENELRKGLGSDGTQGLLEVRNLKKYFDTNRGPLQAVDNISFSIEKGRTLAW